MKPNKIFSCILFLLTLLIISCTGEKKPSIYQEMHRPQFHFSPPEKWINDPNGLVFYEGEYHLFYQFYPDSTVWGPMHWGHAVGKDLVHWEHLPVALYPDSLGYIFSGSAVIDWKNTSGLQTTNYPPMIAVYTQHSEERLRSGRTDYQNQSIAFSNDKGRTFQKYSGNPVIANRGAKDFRDPKVMWNDTFQKWILVLAAGQKVEFFSSSDLLEWEYLSEFGNETGAQGGVWECPDLFTLKIGDKIKWILIVNINPGAPNGGSGTQYFIGEFDGMRFINDNPKETTLWLDYGPDNYAGVTWSDIPDEDGRRILIGWMSNWDYAQLMPTVKWRNAMTLPRELRLTETDDGLRLCSIPVEELKKIRTKTMTPALSPDSPLEIKGLNEITMNISLAGSSASEFGLIFSNDLNEKLVIGFNTISNNYFIDRTHSGKISFSTKFPGIHLAPRLVNDTTLQVHLYLDHSSLELFADDGTIAMTETFFPNENFNNLSFFQKGGNVKLEDFTIYELNTIW